MDLLLTKFKDYPKRQLKQLKIMFDSLYGCGVLNETADGALGDLLPDLVQGITEPLESLRCNLTALDET